MVHAAVREDILTLRMAPGTAVDEVGLAKQFGLSRTPVREALVMLASEGLVRLLPNRSSIVAPLTLENMNAYFDTLLVLSRSVHVAAALQRNAADLKGLRLLADAFRGSIGSGETLKMVFRQLDLQHGIARASRNSFLDRYYNDCLDNGRRTLLIHYFPHIGVDDLYGTADVHDRMIDAISAGDTEACNRLAGDQIADVVRVVQRSLEPSVAQAVDHGTNVFPRFSV